VSKRGRAGWRGLGPVILAGVLVAGPAGAVERLHSGLMDLTLSGGYSLSHDENLEHVDGVQFLPHFGYLFFPYFEVLAEPALIHFRSDSASSTAVGVSLLARLLIDTGTRVAPYVEGGVGFLDGQLDFRQTNCDTNFLIAAGVGAMVFVAERTAVSIGYRFQHISNDNRCSENLGLNSSLFMIGISRFFE
jgi:opacity protein-like surface antigen